MALSHTVSSNAATSGSHLQKRSAHRSASSDLPLQNSVGRSSSSPLVQSTAFGSVRSGSGLSRISAHAAVKEIRRAGGSSRRVKGTNARVRQHWKDQAQESTHVCPLCRAGSGACNAYGTSAWGFDCRSASVDRRQSALRCSPDSPSDSVIEAPPPRSRPEAPTLQPPFDTFDNVPAFDSPLPETHDGVSSFDSPGLTPDAHIPPFEDTVRLGRVVNTPGLDDPSLAPDYNIKDGTNREGTAEASPAVIKDRFSRGVEEPLRAEDDISRVPASQAVAAAKPAVLESPVEEDLLDQGDLWEQAKRIMAFAGPALGIWLGNPTMSLVDTAVIGTASSLELAALGPGTALSDGFGHLFMFLSVATSNLIATSLAEKDPEGAARSLSRALFIALVCGFGITAICETLHTPLLKAFVGKNVGLIPAARVYVQIRGLAWPAVLVTMVAQSACLGMQDAWGPLRVLVVAASINCLGDILLCSVLKMGIAGAAWATAASQIVGCVLMLQSLRKRSTIPLYLSVPRFADLVTFMSIAGPTLVTMFSKVSFYTLMTYVCTANGTATGAGHQVMIGLYAFFAVFGEPLCQTAQSFIPEFIRGANRSLHKARKLLQSLVLMGGLQGLVLGAGAGLMPWVLPQLFSNDAAVIDQMRRASFQIFAANTISGMNLSMEGTLLAGRDLVYLAISMVCSFSIMASALLVGSKRGIGLGGIWWCLVGFQSIRFVSASMRLSNPKSVVGGLRTRRTSPEPIPVVMGK